MFTLEEGKGAVSGSILLTVLQCRFPLAWQVDDSAFLLPRVQRTFDQIAEATQRLSRKYQQNGEDMAVGSLLLAREGFDPRQLLAVGPSTSPMLVDEVPSTTATLSIDDFLARAHEDQILSSIAEASLDASDRFTMALDRFREAEWAREKYRLLPALGRGRLGALSSSTIGASRPLGAFGPDGAGSRLSSAAESYAKAVEDMNSAAVKGNRFSAVERFRASSSAAGVVDTGKVSIASCWTILATMASEARTATEAASRRSGLVRGARIHLESEHASFVDRVITRSPHVARLGGRLGRLDRIQAFLRVKLADQGVLDFDGGMLDTTWQRIYLCLRSGFHQEALEIASESADNEVFKVCGALAGLFVLREKKSL